MLDILLIIAIIMNIGFGVATLLRPYAIAAGTHVTLKGPRGLTEFRTAFGGYFIGMGLAILLINDPQASGAIGIAWAGAAVIRLFEAVNAQLQGHTEIFDRAFFVIWFSEIATAAMLLLQFTR